MIFISFILWIAIVNLLSDENITLEICKKLNRNHRTIKREIENIDRKENGFMYITKRDLKKIKRVISTKTALATNNKEAGFGNINRKDTVYYEYWLNIGK